VRHAHGRVWFAPSRSRLAQAVSPTVGFRSSGPQIAAWLVSCLPGSQSKQALNIRMDDDTSYSCVAAHLYIQRQLLNRRVYDVYSSETDMVPMWSWIINFAFNKSTTNTNPPGTTMLVNSILDGLVT
jgi:hypothetical protein